ncbi:P-type DNA transfer ATPase VirB11 [Legionella feeleii]|uniref:Type IV secretion system protein n=1 Tax=Legionella feeleii TaxID=453 RepID=A0A378IWI9_9GAMM|nr:P-type DNA transfer ATPase VirB11 [Legionella feeleii]STX39290.1 protein LvhB11 [Legionella feeleii]
MSLALKSYLQPLQPFLDHPEIAEICINKPKEVWVELKGRFTCSLIPALTESHLLLLADLIAEYNHKQLSETKPLLSATLPRGERCQLVLPPACAKDQFVCAIRKPTVADLTLADWEKRGAFEAIGENRRNRLNKSYLKLQRLIEEGRYKEMLSFAVRAKLTILISGGTSTAKTTLLNSCLKEIDPHERLITIEGVREVQTAAANCVHLLANEDEEQGKGASMLDLLKVAFRLRPERIFLSELRAREAYPFLRACLSGHPGSLTTLHADSILSAKEQLKFMLREAPELNGVSEARLQTLIRSSVQVIVQMGRRDNGVRVIEDIELQGVDHELV